MCSHADEAGRITTLLMASRDTRDELVKFGYRIVRRRRDRGRRRDAAAYDGREPRERVDVFAIQIPGEIPQPQFVAEGLVARRLDDGAAPQAQQAPQRAAEQEPRDA